MSSVLLNKVAKAKTRAGKQALAKREPQMKEKPIKHAMLIRGTTANANIQMLMKDLSNMKRPNSTYFNKKNDMKPFEDGSKIEFLTHKNMAPLFMFGSHNKKRPNNLVMGRTYDNQILDMFELGIENYIPMNEFKNHLIDLGLKPILLFTGEQFETEPNFIRLKNLLMDFFSNRKAEKVALSELKTTITFVVQNGKVYFRHYVVLKKKSGAKMPRIELKEAGPSFEFTLRRSRVASDDMFRSTLKQPKILKEKKTKNIEKDPLGTTYARVHMERQDYGKLTTRRFEGLKKNTKAEKVEKKRANADKPNPRSKKRKTEEIPDEDMDM